MVQRMESDSKYCHRCLFLCLIPRLLLQFHFAVSWTYSRAFDVMEMIVLDYRSFGRQIRSFSLRTPLCQLDQFASPEVHLHDRFFQCAVLLLAGLAVLQQLLHATWDLIHSRGSQESVCNFKLFPRIFSSSVWLFSSFDHPDEIWPA